MTAHSTGRAAPWPYAPGESISMHPRHRHRMSTEGTDQDRLRALDTEKKMVQEYQQIQKTHSDAQFQKKEI